MYDSIDFESGVAGASTTKAVNLVRRQRGDANTPHVGKTHLKITLLLAGKK